MTVIRLVQYNYVAKAATLSRGEQYSKILPIYLCNISFDMLYTQYQYSNPALRLPQTILATRFKHSFAEQGSTQIQFLVAWILVIPAWDDHPSNTPCHNSPSITVTAHPLIEVILNKANQWPLRFLPFNTSKVTDPTSVALQKQIDT